MWWREDQEVEHGETEKLSSGKICKKCGSISQNITKRYKPESNREHMESPQKCSYRERREKCWI